MVTVMRNERRKNFRVEWNTAGKVVVNGRVICSCIISNLSNGGAKISEVVTAEIPDRFVLHFSELITPRLCQVSWRRDNELGVQFPTSAKGGRPKAPAKVKKARHRERVT
jgi:hypothetical protein